MRTFICVKEQSNENDCVVICDYGTEPNRFSVGFAFGYPFTEHQRLSEEDNGFNGVEFMEYYVFPTERDAMVSVFEGGYPFGTKNRIEEE